MTNAERKACERDRAKATEKRPCGCYREADTGGWIGCPKDEEK